MGPKMPMFPFGTAPEPIRRRHPFRALVSRAAGAPLASQLAAQMPSLVPVLLDVEVGVGTELRGTRRGYPERDRKADR